MSWLSNVIHGKTKTPNTSVQDAEAARQYAALLQQAQDAAAQQQAQYEQTRKDDQARADAQMAAQQAQYEQQRQAAEAETQRQAAAQQQALAQQQAERDAAAAQVAEKAAQARDFATKRQGLVDTSTQAITDAYAGFDQGYFDKFAQSFVDYYKPQLAREAQDEGDKVTYAYADTGGLRSSATAKAFGDLKRGNDEKTANIASAATDSANAFKTDINDQKTSAIGAINAAGSTASPVLPDGTMDVTAGLGSLGSQIGATTQTSANAAKNVTNPSFTSNPVNVSLAGYAKRPTAYGVAS